MGTAKKSIFRKILIPILMALVFQAVLLYGVIAFGGTLAQLRENTYGIFREKVDSGRDQLENEMVQRWSNMGESVEKVLAETGLFLQESEITIDEFLADRKSVIEFLGNAAPDILYLLRKNSVSGAFLMLNDTGGKMKSALYFTDPDPDSNPSDYSDLQVECAPPSVSRMLNIALSSSWAPQIEDADYLQKPLEAARQHPEIGYKDLGYWGRPVYRSGDGVMDQTRIITYSVPLVYKERPFGVLGIEVTLDHLAKRLPEKSLGQTGSTLVLGVSNTDQSGYEIAVASTGAMRQIFVGCEALTLHEYGASEYYEMVGGVDTNRELLAHNAPLRLYNTHTPFESDQWTVLGTVYEADLLRFVKRFQLTLMLACLITFALGILQVFVVSRRIATPVALLSGRVKCANPSLPIVLPRLRIEEIDELSASIEYLSAQVVSAGAKLSRILEMADISIGAFEYSEKGEGNIFLTNRFFQILSGKDQGTDFSTMLSGDFSTMVAKIAEGAVKIETEREDAVYSLHFIHDGATYWSRLKIVRDHDRILGVVTDITQEVLEKKRLEYDRDYDILTNLYNRRAFQVNIHKMVENPEKLGISALIMLDLDNLKFINDTYGHDLGDEYIRSAAMALKKASGPQSLVARLSGDEFVVFLAGFSDREGIRSICDHIQTEFQQTNIMLPDGGKVQIRASAGLAWYPDDATNIEDLVRYADFAMYMVKRVNKGQFTDFNLETYHRESYLLHGREELNLILERGLLDYHFQPVFDARTGEVFGYEALMRPRSETVKSPLELLSLARSQSRLQRVEELTLFCALERFLSMDISSGDKRVFLNTIPSQILTPAQAIEFEARFAHQLHRVIFEITEEERGDPEVTNRKQALTQRWGASIALDDFGVGYNGETALLELAPQYIKLDISIVRNSSTDKNRYQLMENLINYSRTRGIRVIAEGVERKEDMQTLIGAGVDYLQGYYLAKPSAMPQQEYSMAAEQVRKAVEELTGHL